MFNQPRFDEFVMDNGVVGFFSQPVPLASGRLSSWYVNWRSVCSDVYLMDQLVDFVLSFCQQLDVQFDTLLGVAEGATKLGVVAQYKWALQQSCAQGTHGLSMGRAVPKQHGQPEDRFFVGVPRGRIVLLEDVTTTGNSLVKVLDQLLALNMEVVACIGLTHRCQKEVNGQCVEDKVKQRQCSYYAMSYAPDLLTMICQGSGRPSAVICRSIESEFSEFGITSLNLLQ